jgi:hypothetical protein
MADHPAQILSFYQLSPMVDLSKSPASFLRNLLFGAGKTMSAENLEVPVIVGGRTVAPMISPCSSDAPWVRRRAKETKLIRFPRMALRFALNACKVQTTRLPGMNHYADQGEILSAYEIEVAEHQRELRDQMANRLELMVAQLLQGEMSYQDDEGDAWVYTSPKPGGNSFSAADGWDTDDGAPEDDILAAKQVISDEVSEQPTHMLLGSDAMQAFIHNESALRLFGVGGSVRDIRAGNLDLTANFQDSGAIYLGMFAGLQVWGYPRQVTVNGSATDLIRPEWAEIVTVKPGAMNQLYFGPIHNFKSGQRMEWREFSHSWMSLDGQSVCFHTESRPMPVFHKPGSHVSIHVVGV